MEAIWGVVRTILAATAGAWAIKMGYADGDTVNTLLGALGVIVIGIWSVVQKINSKPKA